MASPSPLIMKSRLPLGDGYDLDLSAYERHFPDYTQGSIESDHMTTRSTRFGNNKAKGQVRSRTSRETSSVLSTPTPRLASDAVRKHEPLLPRFIKESSLPTATKPEPQLPRPSKNVSAVRHAASKPQLQHHPDMPVRVSGTTEAQPTATLPLPEVPNLTELVSGVYDNGTPIFSEGKKRNASRFASASQVGENTNQVSLPDADEAKPKYDEKKLLASIRYLENKVLELQHHQAESEHTIQYLRQKAFEAESKGRSAPRRSDSALGSISGGSDVGEDRPEVGQRRLVIEKSRVESSARHLESRINALNEVALAYQDNLKTITQERDTAVSQLGVAYFANEQLKLQNESLQAQNDELRRNIEELMAHQEESTMGFETDPNMTEKELQCDRIMYEREQAENTRQRIKANLRASREQVTDTVPDLPPRALQVSDDTNQSQLTSSTHGEPRVTIDDVSLDLSYLSFARGAATNVRQNLEGQKVDDDQPAVLAPQQESVISHSEFSTPVRGSESSSLGTPDAKYSGTFIVENRPKSSAVGIDQHSAHQDAGEQLANAKPTRKVTPFPMIRTESQPPKSEASIISTESRRDDQSDMTSAWIVPDISIDFPTRTEQYAPQVSEIKEDVSGGEQSDESQSTVERILRQSRTSQSSLLDDNSAFNVERIVSETREAKRSLLDGDSKSTGERSIGQTRANLPSLLDYDSNSTVERSTSQIRATLPSLLDDDPKPVAEYSFTSRRIKESQSVAQCTISQKRPTQRSLLDDDSQSVVAASKAHHQPKKTKVIRRPVPVSNRMPAPDEYEDEPTIRPSQHPGIALATVLQSLEDELSGLKSSAKKYQRVYDTHDPALSRRSRKAVFEKLQTLNKAIDVKADHIYSLYDVLEGQKQHGQEMSQEEVEVTLQSIGIDPEELSYGNDFLGGNKSPQVLMDEPRPVQRRPRSVSSDEEFPWDGVESTGTHSTSSSRRSRHSV